MSPPPESDCQDQEPQRNNKSRMTRYCQYLLLTPNTPEKAQQWNKCSKESQYKTVARRGTSRVKSRRQTSNNPESPRINVEARVHLKARARQPAVTKSAQRVKRNALTVFIACEGLTMSAGAAAVGVPALWNDGVHVTWDSRCRGAGRRLPGASGSPCPRVGSPQRSGVLREPKPQRPCRPPPRRSAACRASSAEHTTFRCAAGLLASRQTYFWVALASDTVE